MQCSRSYTGCKELPCCYDCRMKKDADLKLLRVPRGTADKIELARLQAKVAGYERSSPEWLDMVLLEGLGALRKRVRASGWYGGRARA